MKKIIESVAFILIDNNKILVEKRSMDKRSDPGKIAVPSGGIEKNENQEEAMLREVKEELDVVAIEYKFIETVFYPNVEVDFNVHYFIVTKWEGSITNLEADKLLWINLAEQNLDLSCDKEAIKKLINAM
jgi:8-oxo-dGTP diphosphatase